jgi:hypothetical protein
MTCMRRKLLNSLDFFFLRFEFNYSRMKVTDFRRRASGFATY